MAETPVDFDINVDSIGDLPNVPVCPICTNLLESAASTYQYTRLNPDTRWFFCPDCETHVGYHRMKGNWKIDPYDYSNNNKLRGKIGVPGVVE